MLTFWLANSPLGIHELIANIISWICAVTFAYFTNARWVFDAKPESGRELLRQAVSFYVGRLATLGMEEALIAVFITWLGFPAMGVKIVSQLAVIAANYFISKFLVFKKPSR